MEERLQNSAAEGDVEALYSILAQDPYVLERIDQIPFVDTPLHIAASGGKIHFAKEIVSLKPSFTRKRDLLGRSPMHLALENEHRELVTWFLTFDSELVRVKAKGMVTPLHYAAEIDDDLNLADFLYVCPSSINDLTVKCETAIHVALKNGSFRAFKVLLGWLRHFDKEKILKWEDENGDNALHIATSTNQKKAIKLLTGYIKVNKKNLGGWTPLDIFFLHQDLLDPKIGKILRRAKAKRASELDPDPIAFASRFGAVYLKFRSCFPCCADRKSTLLVDYLRRNLTCKERIMKLLGFGDQSMYTLPSEVRNIVLVVAILNATATYQDAPRLQGGSGQDNSNNNSNLSSYNNVTNIAPIASSGDPEPQVDSAWHVIMRSTLLFLFSSSSMSFYASICTILIIIVGLPFSGVLAFSTYSLLVAYYASDIVSSTEGSIKALFLVISAWTARSIPSFLQHKEKMLRSYSRQGKLRRGNYEDR